MVLLKGASIIWISPLMYFRKENYPYTIKNWFKTPHSIYNVYVWKDTMFDRYDSSDTKKQQNFSRPQCYASRVWRHSKSLENFDFKLPRHILNSNSGNWNCFKTSMKTIHNNYELQKTSLLKLIWGKIDCSLRLTHNWTHSVFSISWMRMDTAAQAGDMIASVPTIL